MSSEPTDTATMLLLPLVYGELRRLAADWMAKIPLGQTLQPTALVHGTDLRLVGSGDSQWENRRHFFFAAARAMQHLLVEHARRKLAPKRGGGAITATGKTTHKPRTA